MGHKPWEQWQVELLKEQYGKMNTQNLADAIGKKKQAVIQYAYKHNISANRYWTKEETQYLLDNFGYMTTGSIARRLNKPYRNVINKINHMKLGSYLDNTDNLHLADVCRVVGRNKETIKRTWFKIGLPYRRRGKYIIITEQNLIKFMKNNPKYWNAHDCDYYFFSRFDWFQKKYKEEGIKIIENRWKNAI